MRVIKSRRSDPEKRNGQLNYQNKQNKKTNNDLQNTKHRKLRIK